MSFGQLFIKNLLNTRCETAPKVINTTLVIGPTAKGVLYEVKKHIYSPHVLTKCLTNATKCISPKNVQKLLCTLSGHLIVVPEYANVSTRDETHINTSATFKQIYVAIATVVKRGLLNIHLMKRLFENALCENARASIVALMVS